MILLIDIQDDLALDFSGKNLIRIGNIAELDHSQLSFDQITAILISIYEPLSATTLRRFKNLSYVGVLGTSLKKIDLDYCRSLNIHVDHVPHYCDEETGEWVIGHIINFFRGIGPFHKRHPQSVNEKTLGLVGVGAVGAHVLRVASALQMNVLYYARSEKPELHTDKVYFATLDEIFSKAHVVSFHTPPHTQWLSMRELSLLKDQALIINTAMGKIDVKEDLSLFINERHDVTVVMDQVAAKNYTMLKQRIYGDEQSAYLTPESSARLYKKFFSNAQDFFSEREC